MITLHLGRTLPSMPEGDRPAWTDWFARMGLDPRMIPVPSEVWLSTEESRVYWSEMVSPLEFRSMSRVQKLVPLPERGSVNVS